MKFVLLAVTFCLISVSQGKDTILTSLGYKQSYNRDESGAILDNTEYSKKFLIDCPNNSLIKNPDIKCNENYPYRSINGVCNNLDYIWYGAANTPYNRILFPKYDDGYQTPRTFAEDEGRFLPNARAISLTLSTNQTKGDLSSLFTYFGQFITHDITLTTQADANCASCDNTNPSCFNIMAYSKDIFLKTEGCFPFKRSADQSTEFTCPSKFRNQFSELTHFFDLSNVYGSSEEENKKVRLFEEGLLKSSFIPGSEYEGLPIFNRTQCTKKKGCFFAGDKRAEVVTLLTVVHTIFMRNHNNMARSYKMRNPYASDEIIYQEVRRINIAIYQNILYGEWHSLVIGKELSRAYNLSPLRSGYLYGYDPKLLPNALNEYAVSAGRLHNVLNEFVNTASNNLVEIGKIHLTDQIFETAETYNDFDRLACGLLVGVSNSPKSLELSNSMCHRLFEDDAPNSIISLNIQRGRDHGIPSYNSYRKLFGLKFAENFDEFLDRIPATSIQDMKKVYTNVNDVDLFYGGIAEFTVEGGVVGPTHAHIHAQNFHNIKFGDRFYFENGHDENLRFTIAQLDNIRHIPMASIMCQTLGLQKIQTYAFQLKDDFKNPIVECDQLPKIRMELFSLGQDNYY